jgi:hypothetical protein
MANHRSKSAVAGLFCFSVCALILQGALCVPAYAQDAAPATGPVKAPVKQIHIYRPRSGSLNSNRLHEPLGPRVTEQPDVPRPLNAGSGIVYTCDPNFASNAPAGTCNYLNTVIAGYYASKFTNANANIYLVYGTTGLGATSSYTNYLTYSQYETAYNSIAGKSAIQTSALSALATYDATPYGSGQVSVTVSLGETLGFPPSDFTGTTPSGDFCTAGTAGCYNAVTTITNDTIDTPLYYDNVGGPEPSDAYDFYAVVMHETDEVLGTSSCITTQTTPLSNGCDGFGPDSSEVGTPAAVDLFRFSSAGHLVLDSALSLTPGAYFSYNGGTTNGAKGNAGNGKFYNTLDNGDDYADFVYTDPENCATNEAIQDAEGCPGEDAGLNILNDGGGEVNILNAVGFSTPSISPAVLSSPTAGSILAATPTTFEWAAVAGVKYYDLHLSAVGPGGADLYASSTTSGTSVTVGGLPVNGTKIYAALYSFIDGAWQHTDTDYTGNSLALGQISSPAPGSTFTGTSETFTWSPVAGITLFDLHLSAIGFGGADIYASGTVKGTSLNVTGLPSNGERIYARFYSWVGGAWQPTDIEYNAYKAPI